MYGHILKKASIWDCWSPEGDAQGLVAAVEFAGVDRELYRIPQFIAPIETAIQKILFQIAIDNQITGFAIACELVAFLLQCLPDLDGGVGRVSF